MGATRANRRSKFFSGLLLAAAMAVVAVVVTFRVADLHVQTVLTGSMRPTVSPGDVAVTQGVPMAALRVGDAIAFYPPGETTPVLHRIRSLETTATGIEITTRGDANSVDDPWLATLHGPTAYRLVVVLPFIGWLTELQRPALLAAGLLLGLAILLELRKEVRARRKTRFEPQS
jgi:signal peptidase